MQVSVPSQSPDRTLRSPPRAWRFVVLLGLVYVLFELAYFAVPDRMLREVVHTRVIAEPAAAVIAWLSPGEAVTAADGALHADGVTLRLVRGCDGSGLAFLLLAAVLAFPARARDLAAGVAGALLLAYLLNEARIVALYFLAAHQPDWFTTAHDFVLPAVIVLAAGLTYGAWVARCARERGVLPAS